MLTKVEFDDTKQNSELWGQLVILWIMDLQPKPNTAQELANQMTAHGITGAKVPGGPDRAVKVMVYQDDGPLYLYLPSKAMVDLAKSMLKPGPYPLPVFYNTAYTGPRASLNADQDELMLDARIGEYTINMCM